MTKFIRAAVLSAFAAASMTALAVAQKPEKDEKAKGELLKTVINATAEFDKEKKTLTIEAVGQVPTGGWKDAKLKKKETKEAPKDGIYEFELTAIRPTGIVTQALSKVTATEKWENPPGDLRQIKILGAGESTKTVKIEK